MTFKYQSLTDRLYQHIKSQIVSNQYKPGERLQEQDIAKSLDVSRTPVREALGRLGAEGLVTVIPRMGVFVTNPCNKDIQDIYEVRECLEILASQLAIGQMSEEGIQKLEEIHRDFGTAFSKKEISNCFEFDRKFHEQLIELSGNTKLVEIYKHLGANIQVTRWMHCAHQKEQALTFKEHANILDALRKRDAETTGKLLSAHIQRVKRDLVGQ